MVPNFFLATRPGINPFHGATSGFQMFAGGIEMEWWHEICQKIK